MDEKAQPAAPKYDVTLSTGPFREPGAEALSYDYFINRKGWLIPRVMRVFVDIKAELEPLQRHLQGVSGGTPGQQLKVTQLLSRKIADRKVVIALEEGRIEKATEVLVKGFTENDAYLFPILEKWMEGAKESLREEIKEKVGL
jgi:hypothetical protein